MEEKERKELARDIAEMVVEKLTDVLENLLRPEARSNDDGDETQTRSCFCDCVFYITQS